MGDMHVAARSCLEIVEDQMALNGFAGLFPGVRMAEGMVPAQVSARSHAARQEPARAGLWP